MKRNVTIKDVAEHAGVSATTVSYVLKKNPNQTISPQTTQRILDAVKELKYIPNNAAKALRSNQTFCVGVALEKTLVVSRYAHVVQGIRSVLDENGYNMILCSERSEKQAKAPYPEFLSYYFEKKIDGIIYIGRDGSGIDSINQKLIIEENIPIVVLDCDEVMESISKVEIDYYKGAYEHAKYLLDNGTRKIIYLRPAFDTTQELRREEGVRRAVEENGVSELIIYNLDITLDEIYNVDHAKIETKIGANRASGKNEIWNIINKELPNLSSQDTILCSWGFWVEFAFSKIYKHGKRVKIGGLADGSLMPELWEDISVSCLPNFEAGKVCAEILFEKMRNQKTEIHKKLSPVLVY